MTLGKKIKSLRKSKNMTQLELAKRLGKDNSTISKWESDIYQPDADELRQIADILSTTTDFLTGRTDSPVEYTASEKSFMDDLHLTDDELINKYKLIIDGKEASEEEIKNAIKYIKALRLMQSDKN